jgi:hypothetical protein
MHLITQPVHVLLYSNSAVKGSNGTNTILWLIDPLLGKDLETKRQQSLLRNGAVNTPL